MFPCHQTLDQVRCLVQMLVILLMSGRAHTVIRTAMTSFPVPFTARALTILLVLHGKGPTDREAQ